MLKMKYKYIMWDWNGTLLDDLQMNFDIENILLSRRGLKNIESIAEYHEKFCFPIIHFYEKLGFDLKNEKFEIIAREYAHLYDEMYPMAEIFPDAERILRLIKNAGIRQLIISQTEQSYLTRQVTYFELDHLFTDILGNSDIYARSKVAVAQKWMSENDAKPSEILFIGDTVHDKEVADSIGCDCVLISSGHNSKERLLSVGVPVLSGISEIEGVINS